MPYRSLLHRLPFWLHSLIELTPSISFFINPAAQLYNLKVTTAMEKRPHCYGSNGLLKHDAEAVIRQYAVLLFVSVLISAIFALRRIDTTSRRVAAALTMYHLAPTARAASRLSAGETAWLPNDIGGPWVHLAVHVVCLLALGGLALGAFPTEDQLNHKAPTKCD